MSKILNKCIKLMEPVFTYSLCKCHLFGLYDLEQCGQIMFRLPWYLGLRLAGKETAELEFQNERVVVTGYRPPPSFFHLILDSDIFKMSPRTLWSPEVRACGCGKMNGPLKNAGRLKWGVWFPNVGTPVFALDLWNPCII